MAKGRSGQSDKPTGRQSGFSKLIKLFERLATARIKIEEFEKIRNQRKTEADQAFETAAKPHKDVLEEFEPQAEALCEAHRDQICGEKKSGIVGPVTVSWKSGPPILLTTKGEEVDTESLLDAVITLELSTRSGKLREKIEACIERKPKLRLSELKKLDEETLERLGVKLASREQFSWKPNAER